MVVDAASQYAEYQRKIAKNRGGQSKRGFKVTGPLGRCFQRLASLSFSYDVFINLNQVRQQLLKISLLFSYKQSRFDYARYFLIHTLETSVYSVIQDLASQRQGLYNESAFRCDSVRSSTRILH